VSKGCIWRSQKYGNRSVFVNFEGLRWSRFTARRAQNLRKRSESKPSGAIIFPCRRRALKFSWLRQFSIKLMPARYPMGVQARPAMLRLASEIWSEHKT
jgi:hypothetical protein